MGPQDLQQEIWLIIQSRCKVDDDIDDDFSDEPDLNDDLLAEVPCL